MPKRSRTDDPDNPPLTEEFFATATRGIKHLPKPMQEAMMNSQRRRLRGKQVAPTKELISIRLDRDALATLRRMGRGWQGLINDVVVRVAATDAAHIIAREAGAGRKGIDVQLAELRETIATLQGMILDQGHTIAALRDRFEAE